MDIKHTLANALHDCAEQFQDLGLRENIASQLQHLATQVDQPCVVAIVGRVKAGKSSFINAFLGDDLAQVGTTETTATINYFTYGNPDPDKPVLCHWQNGTIEAVTREFLNSLQGKDENVLRRSEGIEYLEYRIPNPYLKRITLVDTPGLNAVVDQHQDRTAGYMQLPDHLRERNHQATEKIHRDADAVIYLIGEIVRGTDGDFLSGFNEITGEHARAFNAIGIIAKIDLQQDLINQRHERAVKVAEQLRQNLNTVLPISAGIKRSLEQLAEANDIGLPEFIEAVRRIPPDVLTKMLRGPSLYERTVCPLTQIEKRKLLSNMPWTVFKTFAHTAADNDLTIDEVYKQLDDIAGFEPLKTVLERHFFRRSAFLRSYRIVVDAQRILSQIRYQQIPDIRKNERAQQTQMSRFLDFIHAANGDDRITEELAMFIRNKLDSESRLSLIEANLIEYEEIFAQLAEDLRQYHADFEAYLQLIDVPEQFTNAELDELRPLFGLYGEQRLPLAIESPEAFVIDRQQFWHSVCENDRSSTRRLVANRAIIRYGLILGEISQFGD